MSTKHHLGRAGVALLLVLAVGLLLNAGTANAGKKDGGPTAPMAPSEAPVPSTLETGAPPPCPIDPNGECIVPHVSISASASQVAVGGYVTLTWIGSNIGASCDAYGSWSGPKPCPSGSENVGPFPSAGQYNFIIRGYGGGTFADAAATVTATDSPPPPPSSPPSASISANPTTITDGESVRLSWSCSNATSASSNWAGTVPTSGYTDLYPHNGTTYYITCTNSVGSDTKGVDVSVNGAPPPPPPPPAGCTTHPWPNIIEPGPSGPVGSEVRIGGTFLANFTNAALDAVTAKAWMGTDGYVHAIVPGGTPHQSGYWTLTNGCGVGTLPGAFTITDWVAPDTTPPSVTMTAPANGATVSGTVTVSANASDNVGVAGVQFQLDGANLGSEVTAPPYSTSWNTSGASPGSHSLTAVARDAAGNKTTAQTVTATVRADPPAVTNFTTNTTGPWSGNSVTLNWSSSNSANCDIASNPDSGGAVRGLASSGSWTTPSLTAGQVEYTLTCYNAAGNTSAKLYVGVFDSNEDVVGSDRAGQNNDPERSLDAVQYCRWKSQKNKDEIPLKVGLKGGGLGVQIDWCVNRGRIIKVRRTHWIIGPNYPFSNWKFEGITSTGPCDDNCSNYVDLYGTSRTQINIWMQGHWGLCIGIPVVGDICARQEYRTVGVQIRGDGTRDDTYAP